MPPTVTTVPTPLASDTAKNCTAWYQSVGIQRCQGIVSDFGTFTQEQFIAWNPSAASSCNGLPVCSTPPCHQTQVLIAT